MNAKTLQSTFIIRQNFGVVPNTRDNGLCVCFWQQPVLHQFTGKFMVVIKLIMLKLPLESSKFAKIRMVFC